MPATLSMRTSESAAVRETSLPALLKVARSLPSALPPAAAPLLVCCGAAGAVEGTPKSDFNPSRLLRISIHIAPRSEERRVGKECRRTMGRRHTRCLSDWSSDVCSSDLFAAAQPGLSRAPPRATSIRQDCCEYPYTLLLAGSIDMSANHCSHSRAFMTVLPCRFPVTFPVASLLPEWERSCTIRLAIPNPPCSLSARPRASDANSPSAPPEPESVPESSSAPVSESLPVIGFNNSFIICASNSFAARTSLGCGVAASPVPAVVAVTACIAAPPSQDFQVGLQRAGLLHGLQDRNHVSRPCSCPLQFLDQILHRRSFFQVDAVHRLVLGLHGGLLDDLRGSRGIRVGLRDLGLGDHIHRQSPVQDGNRLQANRAPDDHGPGALVHYHASPRIHLHFDGFHPVQQRLQRA